MGQAKFRVILTGAVVGNFALDEVVKTASRLFKCDEQKARQLLGRKPTPLSRLMDQETAVRYRDQLLKSGIDCRIQPLKSAPATAAQPMKNAQHKRAAQPAGNRRQATTTRSAAVQNVAGAMTGAAKGGATAVVASTQRKPIQHGQKAKAVVPTKPNLSVAGNRSSGTSQRSKTTPVSAAVMQANKPTDENIRTIVDEDVESDVWDELSLFVGKNFEYYQSRFRTFMEQDDDYRFQWNWPAFLIPIPWMIYRKLNVWAAGLIVAHLVLPLLFPLFSILVLPVISGLGGNYFYYLHATRRMDSIVSIDHDRRDEIVHSGGTNSMPLTIGISILVGALFGTLTYVFYLPELLAMIN